MQTPRHTEMHTHAEPQTHRHALGLYFLLFGRFLRGCWFFFEFFLKFFWSFFWRFLEVVWEVFGRLLEVFGEVFGGLGGGLLEVVGREKPLEDLAVRMPQGACPEVRLPARRLGRPQEGIPEFG